MLYPICENKRWGFIDRAGKVVVEPTYTEVRLGTTAGPYPVELKKKWGFVDETGSVVVEPKFYAATAYREGRAAVAVIQKKQLRWGYLDERGGWALEPQFAIAGAFAGGLALAGEQDEQWYIDTEGERRFRVHGSAGFHDGLAIACDPADPQRRGFVGTDGRWVIEPRAWRLHNFSEGLAQAGIVENTDGTWRPDSVGYIDSSGAWAIAARFVDPGGGGGPFSEGLALARTEQAGPAGYIDKSGAWAIEPAAQLACCGNFSEGLAMAGPNSMAQGYIDKTGRHVIDPIFYSAGAFRDGIAFVIPDAKRTAAGGYLDKAGRWLWQPAKPFAKKFQIRS